MKPYRIHQVETTTSTNDDVKEAIVRGEAEGFVVWAAEQKAGRGRRGRTWHSPKGNLYFSVLLKPKTNNLGHYSFMASLALNDLLRDLLPEASLTLKWPNDVLLERKKISGILLESEGDSLILGIGLNVLHHPEDALYPSTSLKEAGKEALSLSDILEKLLTRLFYWYGVLDKKNFSFIRSAWLERAQKGDLRIEQGEETLWGTFKTIDEKGNLVLKLADGSERSISTGDVFLGPKE